MIKTCNYLRIISVFSVTFYRFLSLFQEKVVTLQHNCEINKNPGTCVKVVLMLFTEKFSYDPTRNILWKSFLKKIRWKDSIPFPVVMQCIKDNLQEFWKEDL